MRKQRTRRAILDAALALLADQGFGSLSLRQLAREVGIVPTAFYRHFGTLDEVGMALVEESFATLRAMVREVRRDAPPPEELIDRSVAVLVAQLAEHPTHFRFLVRERYGGVPALREAIARELVGIEHELSTDLARMPGLERWGAEDLAVLAGLFVNLMVGAAGDFVDADTGPVDQRAIATRLRRQARMIVVGADGWEPLGG